MEYKTELSFIQHLPKVMVVKDDLKNTKYIYVYPNAYIFIFVKQGSQFWWKLYLPIRYETCLSKLGKWVRQTLERSVCVKDEGLRETTPRQKRERETGVVR